MFFIYVLWSDKLKKRYIGCTDNLDKRLKEHNRGCNKFTKGGIPWVFIYQEEFINKKEALKREKYVKSGVGRSWLDKILKF